ncbi:MazG nucleotide pyrophosphohydrolase domain-containing protein [Ruania alba]|uniref:MazG nucleotide pyrophosphohydrolase domain-containing protein n=1 Tax=Ruania alba TaxID=648782 RepID=UPI001FE04837|nr:MazG nucleotide pyrophosphohydrolase domain-containing protein [Ruania alba]
MTAPHADPLREAVAVMDRLRSPGGCPWDAEQTHASLAPYAIEEAHELAEAAESGDREHLLEELGDLLLQVLFHARVAAEGSLGEPFDLDDVARTLVAKLTSRHPHVFAADPHEDGGEGEAPSVTASDVNERWEQLKAAEKQRASLLDGIPASTPALARTQKVVRRSERAQVPLPEPGDDIGGRLDAVVRDAVAAGMDAEAALRERVRTLEAAVRAAEAAGVPAAETLAP